MASFNLTAELNLRGPSNLNQVVSNIRRQLSTISLNLNINPATSRGIQAVTADVRTLSAALRDAQSNAVALSTTLRGLGAATANVSRATSTLGSNLGSISGSASGTATAIKAASSEMTEFGRQSALAIRRFAAFSVATGAVYTLSRAITSAYGEFVNFNKEFVRLQQVTDSTASGLTSLSNEITRLSTSLGVSSQELLQVSVTLAQAGLSAGETKTALEALAKSALAPSFDSLNDTVEGSIALMRQFGISASDLESSLGSVNAVAAKFAVEASDIISAIQRTGGVFANASRGVSEGKDALNEFLAVFTSVRATTRESAETIATGLRTIFTRIQRAGTIDALKQYGVELTDLEGKFVGPYEAVRRLSEGLKALDPRDLRFSSIVEELGGFRQIGKVIPLIQQFETAQKALGVAQRGSGSLALDAATAQEALSVRINKVREQFVGLIRDIGQSQGFQTFVDISLKLASALISVADAAKDVLPALAAITAIRGVGALGQFFGGFTGGLTRNKPRGFASGGLVPGTGNRDTVGAMLMPGEFVIRKKAVETIGAANLAKLNKGGYAKRRKGISGAPLVDDIPQATGSILPRPSAIESLIKAGGGAIDIDRTIKRTIGDKAYGLAKTSGQKSTALQRYFRDPTQRLQDVQSSPLTFFGQELRKAIQAGQLNPRRLSIISKSQRVPGVAEYLSQLFGIPTANMIFTQGGDKQPALDALRSKGPRIDRVKRFALGGRSTAGIRRGSRSRFKELTPEEIAQLSTEDMIKYAKAQARDVFSTAGAGMVTSSKFIPVPEERIIPELESSLQTYLGKKGFWQEQVSPFAMPDKKIGKAKDKSSREKSLKRQTSRLSDEVAARAQEWTKIRSGSPIDNYLLSALKDPILSDYRSVRGGASLDKPFHNTRLRQAVNKALDQYDDFDYSSGNIDKFVSAFAAKKFADGGLVQKFAEGGKIEDKISKNMQSGKKYEFGLVGLRSGTGSPMGPTAEDVELMVGKGKGPKRKAVLYKSTLSGITQKNQEKIIEKDISTAFGQMVEKTASTLRSVIGGAKASSNKKQQILRGSPLTSIVGTVFESALGFLGGPYIDKSEKTKSMDFPLGLGKAAASFGIKPNIPTDATRTIGGSGKGNAQMKKQMSRFIAAVEGGEFTKSFEKFKQNKLLERSKTTSSAIVSGYRSRVFDILKDNSVKTMLGSDEARVLASELGVNVNKLNKQALSGSGKASLSGILTTSGRDPEEAYKKIYERLRKVRGLATGGGISGEDNVRALLTPGEFVINKKAAQRIGGAKLNRLNKADKIQGFNKGGPVDHVQRFAAGGSALPARSATPTPFNMVVPPNTISALQEIAAALENMGVSASEAAMLLERGGAVSVTASERAYQADLNRLRIAGASASDIYNAEQRLAEVREQNATKIRTSQQFSGLTGGQLQDIQSGAELGRQRIIENRRSVMQSRGRSADEIQAALADPAFQDYARRTAFERSTSAVTGRSTRDLQRAGIGGQDIEAYVNQSMMNTSTLRQMDQQLLETRRQQLRNETAYTSASSAQQRRMMRELNARTNEEIAERKNIVNQLRKDRGLSGGFFSPTLSNLAGALQTGGALFGMGNLREDAFGMNPGRQRFARGFNRASELTQRAGFGLTFAGGLIGDTIGKMRGGKEGEATSAAISAFVGTAGIGMMFGPIGALTGVVVGATAAIDAWKDSITNATLQEESSAIEIATQKLQTALEKLSTSKTPQEIQVALKSAATEFQKIASSEAKRQNTVAEQNEPGYMASIMRSLTGARSGGAWWDPTGYTGNLIDTTNIDMAKAEREIVSSARQTNVLQSLPQKFELGIQKGLSLQQIQASFPPGELDKLKQLFALASGDTAIARLVTKREALQLEEKDTTSVDATIKDLSDRLFNKDFLKGLQDRIKSEKALAAASASATLKIDLLNQVLSKIGSAASKAAVQFEEAQRQISMQQSVMFGGGQIQGPDRSQENILENVLSYSFEEIRNVIDRIGSEYQFNPAITREAQSAAVNQKILQQELPRILAEVQTREGEGFNPEGASADVIRAKLQQVFAKFIPNVGRRNETIERVMKDLTQRLKSRKGTTVEDLAENESVFADILKNVGAPVEAFSSLLKQTNDVLASVNSSMNEWVSNLSAATDMRIDAQNISIEAGNQLSKVLGEELSLGDMNQVFENTITTLTQRIGAGGAGIPGTGTLDPGTIMQRMLEREKEARDIQGQLDKEKPPVGSERFNELSESLKRAKLEANNLSRAHQTLQKDSSRAANALTKIGELRQVQESRQSSLLDLLKNVNDPEAMMQFTNEVQSFFAQMAGEGTLKNLPAAIAGLERQMAVLPQEQAQAARENFIQSLEKTEGLDQSGKAALTAIIDNITGVSPEMKGLIGEFYKYTDVQKEAITQASDLLVTGANKAATSLINAGVEVQRIISGAGQEAPTAVIPMQPQNNSKGGLIYASKGQYVNYQPRGTDTVPAMLTPGEFVVNAKATKKHRGLLQAINSNSKAGGYSKGGMVYLEGGGYVPVDTSIESDYAAIQEEIKAYDMETQALIEEPKNLIESIQQGTAPKIYLDSDVERLTQRIQEIQNNRNTQKSLDFDSRIAEINIRRQKEELRKIAQTGELAPEQKAQLARTDVAQFGTTFEERQQQREAQAIKTAQEFAEKDKQEQERKNNEWIPISDLLKKPKSNQMLEDQRNERRAQFLAEKQRRREEFLARNPAYQERAEKALSKAQEEKDEATQWYLSDNTSAETGLWLGKKTNSGARKVPDDVVAQYKKDQALKKKQESQEKLLYGSPVDPSDPEATQKKNAAATLTKDQIAEEMKKRRGEQLARKFGWALSDTKPIGTVVGRYEGYEPGEEPFELRELSAEDRQALDDYQMARVTAVERTERERVKTASREASAAAWEVEKAQIAADIRKETEEKAKQEQTKKTIRGIVDFGRRTISIATSTYSQIQTMPEDRWDIDPTTGERRLMSEKEAKDKQLQEQALSVAEQRKKRAEEKAAEAKRIQEEQIQTVAASVQIDPITGRMLNADPVALNEEIAKLEAAEQAELTRLREFYAKNPSNTLTPEQHYERFSDIDDQLKQLRLQKTGLDTARSNFQSQRESEITETEEEYQRFKDIAEGRKRGTIAGRDAEEYARLSLLRGIKPGQINAGMGDIVAAERSIREQHLTKQGRIALEKQERKEYDIAVAKERDALATRAFMPGSNLLQLSYLATGYGTGAAMGLDAKGRSEWGKTQTDESLSSGALGWTGAALDMAMPLGPVDDVAKIFGLGKVAGRLFGKKPVVTQLNKTAMAAATGGKGTGVRGVSRNPLQRVGSEGIMDVTSSPGIGQAAGGDLTFGQRLRDVSQALGGATPEQTARLNNIVEQQRRVASQLTDATGAIDTSNVPMTTPLGDLFPTATTEKVLSETVSTGMTVKPGSSSAQFGPSRLPERRLQAAPSAPVKPQVSSADDVLSDDKLIADTMERLIKEEGPGVAPSLSKPSSGLVADMAAESRVVRATERGLEQTKRFEEMGIQAPDFSRVNILPTTTTTRTQGKGFGSQLMNWTETLVDDAKTSKQLGIKTSDLAQAGAKPGKGRIDITEGMEGGLPTAKEVKDAIRQSQKTKAQTTVSPEIMGMSDQDLAARLQLLQSKIEATKSQKPKIFESDAFGQKRADVKKQLRELESEKKLIEQRLSGIGPKPRPSVSSPTGATKSGGMLSSALENIRGFGSKALERTGSIAKNVKSVLDSPDALKRLSEREKAEVYTVAGLFPPTIVGAGLGLGAFVEEVFDPLGKKKKKNAQYKSLGGTVYASKGTLVPYQPRGTDTVPAMLTPGEFVVNRKSAKQNMGLLKAINNGHNVKPLGFNKGGMVPTKYYELGGDVSAGSSGGGGVSSIGVDASALDAAFSNFNSYVSSLSSVIDGFTQGTTELAGLSQAIGGLGNLGLREGASLMANAGISVKEATTAFSSAMTEFNTAATSLATAIGAIPQSISLTVSGSIPVTVSVNIEGGTGGTTDTAQLEQSIMDKVAIAINSATQGGINIDTATA